MSTSEGRARRGLPTAKELGERIFAARLEASAEQGERIAQDALGRLVGAYLRSEAVTAATVSRWEAGLTIPSVLSIAALAAVCGVDPGWLAFGNASRAPRPRDAIGDPAVAQAHDAVVGIMREKELMRQIDLESAKWTRKWDARFRKYQTRMRAAFRIKDKTERERLAAELTEELERLRKELDEHTSARVRRFEEAGDLPRAEAEKVRTRGKP